jgi:hypothetical protein
MMIRTAVTPWLTVRQVQMDGESISRAAGSFT